MKKHILSLVICFIIGLMTSCSEGFLDKSPYGITTDDNFFQTEEQIWQSLIVSYNNVSSSWFGADWVFGDLCGDDSYKGGQNESDQQQFQDCAYFHATSTNRVCSAAWSNCYAGIRNSNLVIAKAPDASYTNPDNMERHIAEAKFIRARNYLYLVRIFSDVPLLTVPVDPDDETIIPRSPASDIYNQIKLDLEDAAAALPTVSSLDMLTEWGRLSSEAASAMLARAALYFHDYVTARDAAKDVIDCGYYELEPEYQDYFTRIDGPSKEAVWESLFQNTNGQGNGNGFPIWMRSYSAAGWQFNCPTANIRDQFEVGDPRRLYTIMEDGDSYPKLDGSVEVISNTGGLNIDHLNNRKVYDIEANRASDWFSAPRNIPRIRYSDVLLMYAEALIETDGDPQVICDYINMVRQRASNSRRYDIEAYGSTPEEKKASRTYQCADVPLPDVTITDDLTAALRHERRVELAFEQVRFYDLKRWGYEYARPLIIEARGDYGNLQGDLTQDRFNAFPIPQTEIDRSRGTIQQNPGW